MHPDLRGRPTWLFSSGTLAGPPESGHDRDDGQRIGSLVGVRERRLFPGWLERRLLSSAERALWCGGGDFGQGGGDRC